MLLILVPECLMFNDVDSCEAVGNIKGRVHKKHPQWLLQLLGQDN